MRLWENGRFLVGIACSDERCLRIFFFNRIIHLLNVVNCKKVKKRNQSYIIFYIRLYNVQTANFIYNQSSGVESEAYIKWPTQGCENQITIDRETNQI